MTPQAEQARQDLREWITDLEALTRLKELFVENNVARVAEEASDALNLAYRGAQEHAVDAVKVYATTIKAPVTPVTPPVPLKPGAR